MTRHRYPAQAVAGDYLRGAAGLAFCGIAVAATGVEGWLPLTLLSGLCCLFLLFLLRTASKQLQVFETTATALQSSAAIGAWPRRRTIRWAEIESIRLRYYATRRDREKGWMELTVRGRGQRLRLDSHLHGFDAILAGLAGPLRRGSIVVDRGTAANLAALGLLPPGGDGLDHTGGWVEEPAEVPAEGRAGV